MLDTIFGSGGDRKQAQDELRELLVLARTERAALRALLDQPDLYQWVSFVDENHNPHRYPDSRKIA